MATRILALDPGGTTGWASWTDGQYNCGQIGPDEHHLELWDFLGNQQTANFTIVCESFEFRQRARAGLELISKEYIGVAKLFKQERMLELHNNQVQKLVFQTAAMGKGFIKDDKIKAKGLWTKGQKHAMDAMRHLLYYQVITLRQTDIMWDWKDL